MLSGIVKSETDSEIELVDANAKAIRLPKKSLSERRKSNLSMRPNGLEKGLSLKDFAYGVAVSGRIEITPDDPTIQPRSSGTTIAPGVSPGVTTVNGFSPEGGHTQAAP